MALPRKKLPEQRKVVVYRGKAEDHKSRPIARAIEVIGDEKEALRWLGTPVRSLNYVTPISLLSDSKGEKAVLAVLDKLAHAVF